MSKGASSNEDRAGRQSRSLVSQSPPEGATIPSAEEIAILTIVENEAWAALYRRLRIQGRI